MKVLFWIQSSRGTDDVAVRDLHQDRIVPVFNDWVHAHGAVHVSENVVHSGAVELVDYDPLLALIEVEAHIQADLRECGWHQAERRAILQRANRARAAIHREIRRREAQ